jgi:hypothetical protein
MDDTTVENNGYHILCSSMPYILHLHCKTFRCIANSMQRDDQVFKETYQATGKTPLSSFLAANGILKCQLIRLLYVHSTFQYCKKLLVHWIWLSTFQLPLKLADFGRRITQNLFIYLFIHTRGTLREGKLLPRCTSRIQK